MKKIFMVLIVIVNISSVLFAMEESCSKRKRVQKTEKKSKKTKLLPGVLAHLTQASAERVKVELMDEKAQVDTAMAEAETGWGNLPTELQEYIFSFVVEDKKPLDAIQELKKLARVDSSFQTTAHSQLLLKKIAQSYIKFRRTAAHDLITAACSAGDAAIVAAFLHAGFGTQSKLSVKLSTTARAVISKHELDEINQKERTINSPSSCGKLPLMAAVEKGHTHIVAMLVQNSADVNGRNQEGKTALMLACEGGFLPIKNLLVAHGAALDAECKGDTALSLAIKAGRKKVVSSLLADGAKVGITTNGFRDSSLILAIKSGRPDIVDLLLQNSTVKVKFRDLICAAIEGYNDIFFHLYHARGIKSEKLRNIFYCAAANGHDTIVRFLLDKVNKKDLSYSLASAAHQDDHEVMATLFAAGADPNYVVDDSLVFFSSALMNVLVNDDYKLATVFVEGKALKDGSVSAEIAEFFEGIFEGNYARVLTLLNQGIDVDSADKNGMTALMLAVLMRNAAIAELLINKRANVNTEMPIGDHTALSFAVYKKDTAIVQLLLRAGAAMDVEPVIEPLLITAIYLECNEIVQLFLEYGADINVLDDAVRGTPLVAAIEIDNASLVKQLLERGARLSASAFTSAAKLGSKEICALLLEYCGDINMPLEDYGGYNPLDRGLPLEHVANGGNKEMVEFLLNHGALPEFSHILKLRQDVPQDVRELLNGEAYKLNKNKRKMIAECLLDQP